MKVCKSCKKEIDEKATKCPYCQTDQRGWVARHKILSGVIGVIVFFIVIGMVGGKSDKPANSIPAALDTTSSTEPKASQAPVVASSTTLLDLTGNGSKSTQKFTASGDWDLSWTYDCSSFGQQGNFQVYVYDGSGTLSFQNPPVNQLGKKDAGVEHYHTAGTYYLQVNSECKWTMQVKG